MKSGKAAQILNISKPTLLKKLSESGIQAEKTRTGEYIFRWKHLIKLKYLESFRNIKIKPFTLTVCQNKGGVGKTTAVINLASFFSYLGKVLLIDLDGQSNLSQFYNIYYPGSCGAVSSFIENPEKFSEIINPVSENIDLIPNSLEFYQWKDRAAEKNINNYSLKKALKEVKESYDFIIIDTPPGLDLSIKLAIFASDYCIIPVEPQPFNLSGISNVLEQIQYIIDKDSLGVIDVKVLGLFVNMYENQILSNDISLYLSEKYELFDTKIKKLVSVQQSQAEKKSIFDYEENSQTAFDYYDLGFEILRKIL
jgi:chromosome partitioning protein